MALTTSRYKTSFKTWQNMITNLSEVFRNHRMMNFLGTNCHPHSQAGVRGVVEPTLVCRKHTLIVMLYQS